MTRNRTKQIVRAGSETIFRFANPNGFERADRRERVRYLGGPRNMIYEGKWTERVTSAPTLRDSRPRSQPLVRSASLARAIVRAAPPNVWRQRIREILHDSFGRPKQVPTPQCQGSDRRNANT